MKSITTLTLFILVIFLQGLAQPTSKTGLLCKTWKLQSIVPVYNGVDSIMPQKEIESQFIKFNKDSICEWIRGSEKSEGKWYFNNNGILILRCIKINGNLNPLRDRESLFKIKELTSERLIIIYLGREDNTAYFYTLNKER